MDKNVSSTSGLPTGHKRNQANELVRKTLRESGLFNWQLADILHCSVDKVQRMLRHEMDIDRQKELCELIRKASIHE